MEVVLTSILCGVFNCLAGNCQLFYVNGIASFAPFPQCCQIIIIKLLNILGRYMWTQEAKGV